MRIYIQDIKIERVANDNPKTECCSKQKDTRNQVKKKLRRKSYKQNGSYAKQRTREGR